MGFLGNLLGRKSQMPTENARTQQFDEEWTQVVKRFGIVTGLGAINLDLKHPKTGGVMTPHEGLGQTFREWQSVEAEYDRRAVLFDQVFQMAGAHMNRWQVANYLTAVRRPDKAAEFLAQAEASEQGTAGFQAASAKALLNLGRYAESLPQAQSAAANAPADTRLRTLYADALHLNGQGKNAHTIYAELMAAAPTMDADSDTVAPMFDSLFRLETGSVPSPVLALEIAEQMSNPAQAEEFWRLAETEFYDSAYFRMHHAYFLTNSGAADRGFAKLLALVKEMPWLREASLNLRQDFKALDPAGSIMPEFQAQLQDTIRKNQWTTDGMTRIVPSENG